ncbi:MAG: hypothetical protein SFY92_01670 [Verrucomicrobiae bacterium]|nr:hypothetical protein [Verrucomicrobiae bacterium]
MKPRILHPRHGGLRLWCVIPLLCLYLVLVLVQIALTPRTIPDRKTVPHEN